MPRRGQRKNKTAGINEEGLSKGVPIRWKETRIFERRTTKAGGSNNKSYKSGAKNQIIQDSHKEGPIREVDACPTRGVS